MVPSASWISVLSCLDLGVQITLQAVVLTVKVDKDGNFSKFKARWVCRGFQDKHGLEQQTDSPTATRYGFRLVCQQAASSLWDLLNLDLKTAFLQRGTLQFIAPGCHY